MEIAITLLSIIHVLISLLLLFIVMMQRPKQEGLGAAFGGDMTAQMFGAQTTNVLKKGTVFLAVIFFLNSILIAGLLARQSAMEDVSPLLPGEEAPALPDQPDQPPPGLGQPDEDPLLPTPDEALPEEPTPESTDLLPEPEATPQDPDADPTADELSDSEEAEETGEAPEADEAEEQNQENS